MPVQPRGNLLGIVHQWAYAPVGGLRLRFPFLWFRLEQQGHIQQGQQLLDCVAGVHPIAYVALFGNIREGKEPYHVGGGMNFRGNIQGVSYTGRVVVWDHGNLPPSELPVVVLPPFARAHGVAGGDQAGVAQAVNVFLSLDDPDPFRRFGLNQFRQAVEGGLYAFEIPNPSVRDGGVGAPLQNLLGSASRDTEADHLETQGPVGVQVIVGPLDFLSLGSWPVREFDSPCLRQLLRSALSADPAFDLSLYGVDPQAGGATFPVGMPRAPRLAFPFSVGLLYQVTVSAELIERIHLFPA